MPSELPRAERIEQAARRLGIPPQRLENYMRRTKGDLAAAIAIYEARQPDRPERPHEARRKKAGAKPVVWQDRIFPSREAFTEWLAVEIGISKGLVAHHLYKNDWNIAVVVAYFAERAARAERELAAQIAEGKPPVFVGKPTPTAPQTPPPAPLVVYPGRYSNAVAVCYGGQWYPSKTALVERLENQGVLARGDTLRLLFEPLDEDIKPRLDYFIARADRLAAAPPPDPPPPWAYVGQIFPSRVRLRDWLVSELGITEQEGQAIVLGLYGDVTAEIENYCRAFGMTPPPRPADPPTPKGPARIPAPETSPPPETMPPLETAPAPFPPTNSGNGTNSIAQPLAALAAAFARQHDELVRLASATLPHVNGHLAAGQADAAQADGGPISRQLQTQGERLDQLFMRLIQIERSEQNKHQEVAKLGDTLAVVLHKVGQIAHDLGQARSPSPTVPRHTRKRPLGIDIPAEKLV